MHPANYLPSVAEANENDEEERKLAVTSACHAS
jgi:hypothetical protein